jgi:hypothetical protein
VVEAKPREVAYYYDATMVPHPPPPVLTSGGEPATQKPMARLRGSGQIACLH